MGVRLRQWIQLPIFSQVQPKPDPHRLPGGRAVGVQDWRSASKKIIGFGSGMGLNQMGMGINQMGMGMYSTGFLSRKGVCTGPPHRGVEVVPPGF